MLRLRKDESIWETDLPIPQSCFNFTFNKEQGSDSEYIKIPCTYQPRETCIPVSSTLIYLLSLFLSSLSLSLQSDFDLLFTEGKAAID